MDKVWLDRCNCKLILIKIVGFKDGLWKDGIKKIVFYYVYWSYRGIGYGW